MTIETLLRHSPAPSRPGTLPGVPAAPAPPDQEADPAMPLQLTCPNCGATDLVMEQGARFCEACGYGVDEPVTGAEEPSEFQGPKPCVSCGGTEIDAEGYCTDCGDLQPRRRDRMEVDLGVVAGISDRGLRHHRNEDSMALRPVLGLDGRNLVVAVVCDGVSTSERPDEASAAAVSAAAKLLLTAIAAGHAGRRAGLGVGPGPGADVGARRAGRDRGDGLGGARGRRAGPGRGRERARNR